MLRPQGYAVSMGLWGETHERDTFTCAHCQHVTFVEPKCDPAELGGHCKVCDKLICKHCVGHGCTPWEKAMERFEAREAALRSYGMR